MQWHENAIIANRMARRLFIDLLCMKRASAKAWHYNRRGQGGHGLPALVFFAAGINFVTFGLNYSVLAPQKYCRKSSTSSLIPALELNNFWNLINWYLFCQQLYRD
jgi:hypothetical protein